MEIVLYSKYKDKLKDYFFLEVLSFILFSDNNQDQLLISSGYAGCPLLPLPSKKAIASIWYIYFLKQRLENPFAHMNFSVIVAICVVFLSEKTFAANNINGSALEVC